MYVCMYVCRAWEWKAGGVNSAPEEANKVAVTIRDVHLEALDQVNLTLLSFFCVYVC